MFYVISSYVISSNEKKHIHHAFLKLYALMKKKKENNKKD